MSKTRKIFTIHNQTDNPNDWGVTTLSLSDKKEIIPFGSDNLYPQAVQELLRNSPVLRGGLASKIRYCQGNGIIAETDKEQRIIDEINAQENLEDIYKKHLQDYINGGNAYLEVVKKGNAISFFHIDWQKVRKGKGKLEGTFVINPDWAHRDRKKDIVIPEWPNWVKMKDGYHTILHLKDYESGFDHYGIMEWIAGFNAGTIAWKTDKWNLSRLNNDMRPSGIVITSVSSIEEAQELKDYYEKNMQGAENVGKLMFIVNVGDKNTGKFEKLTQDDEGNWIALRDSARQDIITAINWFDVLMGQSKPGQLGNTQELRNVYQLALHNTIKPTQRLFKKWYERALRSVFGIDFNLHFENTNPISLIDKIDWNKVLTKREAYEMAGRTPDENRTDLDNVISE